MKTVTSVPKNNRASLAFLGGLVLTASLAVGTDGLGHFMLRSDVAVVPMHAVYEAQPGRGLTAADWQDAATAWTYFERHYRPETGFVDAVADHPNATMWDQGSHVFALLAAEGLGLIDAAEFQVRSAALMRGLERMTLFDGMLPNKAYDTRTLAMVDYANVSAPEGIGWSALDVARLLMALRVFEMRNPTYGPRIRQLLAGWDLDAMSAQGRLRGATRKDGATSYHQEGRIGYEQYGARAAALWGLDVLAASNAGPILGWKEISGVEVPIDVRRADSFGALTPTLSEPYFLQAFEVGLTSEGAVLASRIYAAQQARFDATGIPTMVSEDHIDQAPYFLYSSIHGNGADWAVIAENGSRHDALRTVSLKTTVAWDALYETTYTQDMRARLRRLASPQGWQAGLYEADFHPNTALTLNTNAVVLEALHFKHSGPLLR